ncbi:MAG: rhomboid family intramembrane serine protease [Gemmatimonadota bacterium]
MAYRSSFGGSPFGAYVTPWVKRLLIANAVVWFLIATRVLPRDLAVAWLAFTPREILVEPWTLVTYMFVHADFFHLFFNLLMLFFFGPPLEERWGGSEFIKYYLICGAGAVLVSLIFGEGPVIGASGAMYGLLLAFALQWPDAPIYIWALLPVKAKYLALFLGAFSLLSGLGGAGGVAHFAHVGGLVVGYLYLKKGWRLNLRVEDLRRRWRRPKLTAVPGGDEESDGPGAGPGHGETGGAGSRRRRGNGDAAVWDEVDRVLDKIAASGLGSLTPEERHFLDEISKRYREK